MVYTTLIEPLGIITISLILGGFFGAYFMFLLMYKTEQKLSKELDSKNRLLNIYKKTYENDECKNS
mgnify:CR=1 FL=1